MQAQYESLMGRPGLSFTEIRNLTWRERKYWVDWYRHFAEKARLDQEYSNNTDDKPPTSPTFTNTRR